MGRVTGIGGIFFKARDADALRAWYREHLGSERRAEGCRVDDKVEESEFGTFGWVHDPEGNRLELWEPPPGKSS
jgi:hypothetical protein